MNPEPSPPDEQPRYFTVFDLIRHWLLIGPTCGGFYLGLSLFESLGQSTGKPFPLGGCCCGFGFALVAYFVALGFFMDMSRRANKESPRDPPKPE